MSIVSTTFVALAMNTVALREQGILKRLRGTPLPSGAYLSAVGLHAITNTVVQVTLVVVAGRLFFGVGWPKDVLELVVFGAAGVVCFASLGVALAHAIPNFDAAPAYTNAVFLPLIVLSGVFYDAEDAPTFLHDIAVALPLTHLIDGLSGAMVTGESLADNLVAPRGHRGVGGRSGSCWRSAASAGTRGGTSPRSGPASTVGRCGPAARCRPWGHGEGSRPGLDGHRRRRGAPRRGGRLGARA